MFDREDLCNYPPSIINTVKFFRIYYFMAKSRFGCFSFSHIYIILLCARHLKIDRTKVAPESFIYVKNALSPKTFTQKIQRPTSKSEATDCLKFLIFALK